MKPSYNVVVRQTVRKIILSDNPVVVYCVGTVVSFIVLSLFIWVRHDAWTTFDLFYPFFGGGLNLWSSERRKRRKLPVVTQSRD